MDNGSDNLDQLRLGETGGPLRLDRPSECARASALMVAQARRRLRIFTPDLQAAIYDQQAFLDAVSGLAVASPRSRVQILVKDSGAAVRHGHRLIELARRLSSAIEVRQVHPDHQDHAQSFLVADDTGVIKSDPTDPREFVADFQTPLEARRLADFFDEVWERSTPDPELLRLYL